jgi:hypothetical protein
MLSCPKNLTTCKGTCVDTGNDPANCGGCGMACVAGMNAMAGCSAGRCAYSCAPKYGDCDGMSANGCEVDLTADVNNCGLCASKCVAPANSVAVCRVAMCSFTCNMGWNNCDNAPGNGCESNPQTDLANCGACGVACLQAQNSTPVCAAGKCDVTCAMNFANCNKDPKDGCEVNLQKDNANCSACGMACGGNTPVCIAGKCVGTHNQAALMTDYVTQASNCGDSSVWYTQELGQMTYDDCEAAANKYGAQYMGQTGYFGSYSAPYQNTVRWVGEADANNGWASTNSWPTVTLTPRGNKLDCVLAYANANSPGNGVFNTSWQSANGKTYLVNDYGVISEKVCYSNALAAGARPLNPWMFAAATKTPAHMVENHTCHGSVEYTGLGTYTSDGGGTHTYRCLVGYNP